MPNPADKSSAQPSFDELLFAAPDKKPENQKKRKPESTLSAIPETSILSAATTRLPATPTAAPWTGDPLRQEAKEEQSETVTKADFARQKVDEGIASLVAALEAGNSEALTAYLTTMGRFHHYSWGNTVLIAFQNPEATHVAGFTAWKGMGRNVIKGEKGIMILAPIPKRFKAEAGETTSSGKDERTDTKEKTVTSGVPPLTSGVWGFKVVYVFDVSQTEGKELPQFAQVKGNPAEKLDRLKNLIEEEGIGLFYNENLGGAFGRSHKGQVEILSGLTPPHEFSVLVHELAHEFLHQDRTRRGVAEKTLRETEAEAVAFVVCQAIGLETGSQHADYIKLYRGDTEVLTASLTAIQETATRILSALEDAKNK